MMGMGKVNGGGWGSSFNIPLVLVKQKEKLNINVFHCPKWEECQNRRGTGAAESVCAEQGDVCMLSCLWFLTCEVSRD